MRKLFFCICAILTLLTSSGAFAQDAKSDSAVSEPTVKVDYKKLEKLVEKHRDEYDSLVSRFIAADTTLTLTDVATVYYGFSCTSHYSPYAINEALDDALKSNASHE